MPGEGGSSGPRNGVVRPLVHVLDAKGVARLCPLLEIDRLRGTDQGARWVLAPSDARLDAGTIRRAVERALEGAVELDARFVRAAVEPGEAPSLRVILRRPVPRAREAIPSRARVSVKDGAGAEVYSGEVELVGPREMRSGLLAVRTATPLPPGLYHAEVSTPDAAVAPARGDDRLLGEGRGAPRRRTEALRLPRLDPRRRQGAAGGGDDLHGVGRPPQVPLRAEPGLVGPGLRVHEAPGHQHGPHGPLDGLVADRCSTRARSTKTCSRRSTRTCSPPRRTASTSASTSSRSSPRPTATRTRTSTRGRSRASARSSRSWPAAIAAWAGSTGT